MEYGKITKGILDWAETKGHFKWRELHAEYIKLSNGSNAMGYHLPNWTNEDTDRKCGRFIYKEGRSYTMLTRPKHKHLVKLLILHKRMRDCRQYYFKTNASLDVYDPLVSAMADVCTTIGNCKNSVDFNIPSKDMQTFNYWYRESDLNYLEMPDIR